MGEPHTFRDRGQLILVGALSLAIVLVGLALVLNSAIFAENFATRANQAEAGQITELEQQAVQGAGGAMQYHHHNNSSHSTYDDLESNFNTSIDGWSGMVVQDSARRGQYVDANYTGTYTKGTRVAQDDGSTFEPQISDLLDEIYNLSGVNTWAATPDAANVRAFRINATHSEIGDNLYAETNVSTFLLDLGGSISVSSRPYTVGYNTDGATNQVPEHSVAIYRPDDSDGDSKDVKLTHLNHSSGVTTTCEFTVAGSQTRIDVSNGRVEGAGGACREVFEFQSSLGQHQLVFIQPGEIEGNYEFIVDDGQSQFRSDYEDSNGLIDVLNNTLAYEDFDDYYNEHNDGHGSSYSPTSPYVEPAMYSAELRVRYQTDTTSYNGTRTVAPNEP